MLTFFARHPTAANLLMISIIVLGLLRAPKMNRETMPDFVPGFIDIRVVYKGASAEEVEETVCERIEEVLEGVDGIESVESTASEGVGFVHVEAVDGYDVRKLQTDIENEIDQIDDFPEESEPPVLWEVEQEDSVIQVALTGDMSPKDLYGLADTVKSELLALEGVSKVRLKGFSEHEIRIEVPREVLLAHGLTISDIARVIRNQSLDLPAGTLETDEREIRIRVVDQRRTVEDFRDLVVVSSSSGARIPLRSIATVTDTFEDDWNIATYRGRRAAVLEITKSDTGDAIRIADTVRDYVSRRKKTLPPGVRMVPLLDVSSVVKDRLMMLVDNGRVGFVLVFLVLWLFLDLRLSFWVAMGIPVSFLGTLWLMQVFGHSLNMITMVSLIIALGLIVDDAIVIGENVYEHRFRGSSSLEAAVKGTSEVASGVVSSMLTTVAVFLPLMMMQGEIGKVLRVLPFGVIAALVVSLVEGFLILPNHLAHSLRRERKVGNIRRKIDETVDWVIHRWYGPVLERSVGASHVTFALVILFFFAALGLLAGRRVAFQAFPDLDGDVIVARLLLPEGTDFDRTRRIVNQIEAVLEEVNAEFSPRQPEHQNLVRHVVTLYGVNSNSNVPGSHAATILVELLHADARVGRCEEIMQRWETLVGEIPDVVSLTFDQVEIGPGGKEIEIELVGEDLESLKKASLDLQKRLRNYPGIRNLMDDLLPGKEEVHVRLDPMARSLGVTSGDLARQLRSSFWYNTAEEFQRRGETYNVNVKLHPLDRNALDDLDRFRVLLPTGAQIPFREVAELEHVRGFSKIVRVDGKRTVSVTADVDGRQGNASQILTDLQTRFFPEFLRRNPGVSIRLEGQLEDALKTGKSALEGLVIGLIAIFILLAFVFESYFEPLIVMSTIPLGLIGSIFGHLIMGIDWSMPSTVGFVSLSGIVVNDSIVLVTFIKARFEEGRKPDQAILEAGKRRFRAVFLTTATTVAGLLPMVLETSLQAQILVPLVVSIAFGLTFATVLTLVLVPCLYRMVWDLRERFYGSTEPLGVGVN